MFKGIFSFLVAIWEIVKRFLNWRKATEPARKKQEADNAVATHDDKATNDIMDRNLP